MSIHTAIAVARVSRVRVRVGLASQASRVYLPRAKLAPCIASAFKFWKSVYISSNGVLRTVFSCFAHSEDFHQFCSLYGVSVKYMKFNELTCIVYEHFRTSINTV